MTLLAHQREAKAACLEKPRYALFMEPGTGKTLTMLKVLEESGDLPALVLCPLSIVRSAWLEDAKKFGLNLRIKSGTGAKLKRAKARDELLRGEIDVLVLNYESYRCDKDAWIQIGKSGKLLSLVMDESTKVRSPFTAISKCVRALSRLVKRSHVMSGCPTPKSMLEMWPQMYCATPAALGEFYNPYREQYFYQPNSELSWLWIERPKSRERILERVKPFSMYKEKAECLDLPEQTYVRREVELSRVERNAYDTFMKTWVLSLGDAHAIGQNALVELQKACQIVAGIVSVQSQWGEPQWMELGKTKLHAIHELLDEMGQKQVMIAGMYRFELERIAASLPGSRILYGGLSEREREEIIQGFKGDDFQYLLCHPAAMAHGLTFTNASDVIWATIPFNYEHYYQLNARIHRIGQENKCTYYLIEALDTIDQRAIMALSSKCDLALDVAAALRVRYGI